jgi:ABC-type transporter Mla subunit MlaD
MPTRPDVQVQHVYIHADRKLEQRLDAIDQAVASLAEDVREVLRDRQAQIDDAAATLHGQSDNLRTHVETSQPSFTRKKKE